jgi:hypothetical protein
MTELTNVNSDSLYQKVDDALPAILPALSRDEARKAIGAIARQFGGVKHGSPAMLYPFKWNRAARVCWMSREETRGHHKGWGRLIHDAAHMIYDRRHPNDRGHGPAHAALEREIAQWVVYTNLMTKVRGEMPAAKSTEEKRRAKLANLELGIKRWESKLRRATNALKKLKARQRATLRALENR